MKQKRQEPVSYGLKGAISGEWDGETVVPLRNAEGYDSDALLPLYDVPLGKVIVNKDLLQIALDTIYDMKNGDLRMASIYAKTTEKLLREALECAQPQDAYPFIKQEE